MLYQDQDNRIGENLRRLREGCGFSQKQVADAVHIDRSTYTNYELGKICPPLNMVYRLANAFHVDYTQILEGDSGRTAPLGDGGTLLQQYPRSTYELTAREQQLVLHYRMMTAEDQQRLYDQLRALAHKKRSHD